MLDKIKTKSELDSEWLMTVMPQSLIYEGVPGNADKQQNASIHPEQLINQEGVAFKKQLIAFIVARSFCDQLFLLLIRSINIIIVTWHFTSIVVGFSCHLWGVRLCFT